MLSNRPVWMAVSAIIMIFFLFGCKSTPEAIEEEEPVSTEKPVEEPKKETMAKPADEVKQEAKEDAKEKTEEAIVVSIDEARAAVRRANLMGANRYFPAEYRELLKALNSGAGMTDSDPKNAQLIVLGVITDANALYDKTLLTRQQEYLDLYTRYDDALLEIQAEKYAMDEYKSIENMAMEVRNLIKKNQLKDSLEKADSTLQAQVRLHHNLSENIRYVGILKRDTINYINDAEDNEAYIYASEELDSANENYEKGISEFQEYKLKESADTLTEAKHQAVLAARVSAVRKKQNETDMLMMDTQQRLEKASTIATVNSDGSVAQAKPWEGDDYLSQNPLIDHTENIGDVEIEAPQLRNLDDPVEDDVNIPSDVFIEDEGTQVNADEENADYLEFAQNLWEMGVNARNEGQFDSANDYFRQAQAYIDVYEANAVFKTYTVVYRKIATDALWRIAERGDIYDNPFLWPKIWRANRRIIQNPDLIYPDQVLVIPPK